MKKFYVYMYLRDDNTPYYVGKGSGKRAWSTVRNIKRPKDDNRIILIYKNLDEKESFKLEKYFISYYGRKDLGTGILRNLTDGGDGATGRKNNKIQSINQSLRQMGVGNHQYGKRGIKSHNFGKFGEDFPGSKSFIVKSPNGDIYHVRGMRFFCKDKNLNPSHMIQVARGNRKHHKNWKCEYKEDNNG